MKKTTLLLAVLIVLVLGAGLLYQNLSDKVDRQELVGGATEAVPEASAQGETQAAEAELAPDFSFLDWEGNMVKLSDFRGKPVILNFWASWCGPCKKEMPEFQKAWEEKGEEIHFLIVNLTDNKDETVESVTGFIEDAGFTFPVYFDVNMEGAIAYGTNRVPVTYFIDENGGMVAYGSGALNEETLDKGIGMLLGE